MPSRDPAFLWESEMLRTADNTPPAGDGGVESQDWLTLREAEVITGVPSNTIRKWARKDNVPSYMRQTPGGPIRLVSMEGVKAWAAEIGRDLQTHSATDDQPRDNIDLTAAEEMGDEGAQLPADSMLVPLDAWNRMLNQLGNLHEAGQQLAEARERAAKAETEALFLRERLAELRNQTPPEEIPPGAPEAIPDRKPTSLTVKLYREWRNHRKRR